MIWNVWWNMGKLFLNILIFELIFCVYDVIHINLTFNFLRWTRSLKRYNISSVIYSDENIPVIQFYGIANSCVVAFTWIASMCCILVPIKWNLIFEEEKIHKMNRVVVGYGEYSATIKEPHKTMYFGATSALYVFFQEW